jgi:hypothetical protein
MEQISVEVSATHTAYKFQARQVALTVTFFTPSFPKDLDLLSRPVTYLAFGVSAQGEHDVAILLDVDPLVSVNTRDEAVTWGRVVSSIFRTFDLPSYSGRLLVLVVLLLAPMGARSKAVRRWLRSRPAGPSADSV